MWIVFQSLAQPTDVHIQCARVFHVICIPNRFKQFLPAKNLSGLFHHFFQQICQAGREPDFLAAIHSQAAIRVKNQIPPGENAFVAVLFKRPQAVV